MNWKRQDDGGLVGEGWNWLCHVTLNSPLYRCRVYRQGTGRLVFDALAEHEEMARHTCEVYVQTRRLTDLVAELQAWARTFGPGEGVVKGDNFGHGIKAAKAQVADLIRKAIQ